MTWGPCPGTAREAAPPELRPPGPSPLLPSTRPPAPSSPRHSGLQSTDGRDPDPFHPEGRAWSRHLLCHSGPTFDFDSSGPAAPPTSVRALAKKASFSFFLPLTRASSRRLEGGLGSEPDPTPHLRARPSAFVPPTPGLPLLQSQKRPRHLADPESQGPAEQADLDVFIPVFLGRREAWPPKDGEARSRRKVRGGLEGQRHWAPDAEGQWVRAGVPRFQAERQCRCHGGRGRRMKTEDAEQPRTRSRAQSPGDGVTRTLGAGPRNCGAPCPPCCSGTEHRRPPQDPTQRERCKDQAWTVLGGQPSVWGKRGGRKSCGRRYGRAGDRGHLGQEQCPGLEWGQCSK